ncbi:MAG TPA: aminopeptidase P family N-terminal domain-containing protein [Gammaproteobacteria bacterium]|nr:aminopeptidase P family N-terminal domain-containing protein [Gammaproteobacteria bacterium]
MISMEPVLKRGYSSWDRDVLPDDEYALRVEAVRAQLRERGLAALVVVNYSLLGVMVDYADMAYLSGLQSGGALLIPSDGEPAYVGFGGGRELKFMRTLTWLDHVISGGGPKAFEVVREQLRARGITSGPVAIAGAADLPAGAAARVQQALADYTLQPFDAELRALRAVKRPREILTMRLTLGLVEDAVYAGLAKFAGGGDNAAAMLEAERVARARKARDVRVLANMGGPELRPFEGRLDGRHGPLRLWVAAQYQGYWAEAAATSPAPKTSAASKAVAAMLGAARTGATTGEVATAAVAALSPVEAQAALEYGLGGTIGLAHDEGVRIRPGGTERLVEGSVLALRAHVAAGAEPSLDAAVASVGASGATRLQALKIAG